ncbi:omega-amidase NIT2 [Ischnura elegans]|uniref:omega-amidase NIT2 n=1 Tax=Ischnura elegans TaxID=197161 RepID=UPI001ED8995D|nr:omega-amidase NIT2 [Ischnura elegans]
MVVNVILRRLSPISSRSLFSSWASMEKLSLRLGVVQSIAREDKNENLKVAKEKIEELVRKNCDIIVLPECFNSPYGTDYFPKYAEEIPDGETSQFLKEMASENKIHLVGGSIPEREGQDLFNTSTVWNPDGELICRHRKIHLFDINIPGGIQFQESSTLKAGNKVTTFTAHDWKFGIGICYDLRFEELARLYRNKGCHVILYPGAFNWTTGPLHWELLLRGRAVDNQVYVAGVSGAYCPQASYQAWGHSTVVDPMGQVVTKAKHDEAVFCVDLDMSLVEKVRQQIPVFSQRRTDVYETVEKEL